MELYLNDRSLVCPGRLGAHWEAITRFCNLVDALKSFGLTKIVCPAGYKHCVLGGVKLAACYPPSEVLTADRRNELITLMDSSFREAREGELDASLVFSEDSEFQNASFTLGNACAADLPVVSLACDSSFEVDEWHGLFRRGEGKPMKAVVRNLYQKTEEMPVSLISFPLGARKKSAQAEPMWNVEMAGCYLSNVGHLPQRSVSFKTVEEKQAYLIRHATMIARLNGWEYHPTISTLNRKKGVLRYIFYSARFRQKDTYLSIDLEHEDIRFELCDYDGCHLKEIRWDGTVTDNNPKSNHNIIVHGK